MKYRVIKYFVAIIVFILLYVNLASAQGSGGSQNLPKGGLLSDVKAHRIGDIVTILISESSQASNSSNTQTSSQNDLSGTADFGGTFLKSLTGSISSSNQNQYQGTGQVTSQGSFTAQLTARILEVREDGNFLIRGSREVETNGEKVITVVEGIIRPADISTANTINSNKISDARIFYDSKGVTVSSSKPGLFTRVLNWIF